MSDNRRLYVVDVHATGYVVAENDKKAMEVAKSYRVDFMAEAEWTVQPNGRASIPADWQDDWPYGDIDEEGTVAQWHASEMERMR